MRMIKTSTAGYISVIQFVLGACFGYSVIAGIIAGLVTSLILNYFGVDIELENSLDEQDNKEDENGGEPAKTREELKK
jgi:hypothetical protein